MSLSSVERVVEAEAYAFTKLAEHLRMRTDVQNIDVMILAGFCRNCLSKWCLAHMTLGQEGPLSRTLSTLCRYHAGARHYGVEMSYEQACEHVYGMPYSEWKRLHQQPATEEQMRRLEETKAGHAQHQKQPSVAAPAAPPAPRLMSDVCCNPVQKPPDQPPPVQVGPPVRMSCHQLTNQPTNQPISNAPSIAVTATRPCPPPPSRLRRWARWSFDWAC